MYISNCSMFTFNTPRQGYSIKFKLFASPKGCVFDQKIKTIQMPHLYLYPFISFQTLIPAWLELVSFKSDCKESFHCILLTKYKALIYVSQGWFLYNLRSGSIFVSLWKLHSGGQGETKREPETFNEMSAVHFFDWLTFAESANQNYFRCLFF